MGTVMVWLDTASVPRVQPVPADAVANPLFEEVALGAVHPVGMARVSSEPPVRKRRWRGR